MTQRDRDGHFAETGMHLSFHGTNAVDDRVDREDGSYALEHLIDHVNFVFNFNRPRNVVSSTQRERASLYAADGQSIGTITVHVTHHLTYSDLNGDFEPDPGPLLKVQVPAFDEERASEAVSILRPLRTEQQASGNELQRRAIP